ncbi:calpain-10 [Brachyhypopomus gauderio]|uniref:calpain-10 n=1 Tax=Brachyhypopomus gauderio TaxID=698409 RepID=UPI004041FB2E
METAARDAALFEDADFAADDSSLFSDYATPLSQLVSGITWLRPQHICRDPCLFPESRPEAYPKQGILGDCWLLCACNMLLKSQALLEQVMPPRQCVWGERGYRGEFRFRFWHCGVWREVLVDDRLPCTNNTLCFSRCHSTSAFWVALLEKAYAKLHGSYEKLWAGQVCEAVVDLSGGVAERWSLKSAVDTPTGRSLLPELSEEMRKRSYISCCVHSTPAGVSVLGEFHALSVEEWTDVNTTSGGRVRLLRIRNPWGRRSWGGAWNEGGVGWSSLDPSFSQDLLARTQQGEFWVDETEFQQDFDEVTVGYPISDDFHLQSIYTGSSLPHTKHMCGRWVKGHSAGGCRNNSSYGNNPKFWLRVGEAGEVLMTLLQCRWSSQRSYTQLPPGGSKSTAQHTQYQAIALHVWKVDRKHFNLVQTLNAEPCASSHTHAYEREVVVHTHLSAGLHLLVPSTFTQGAEGDFLLRVYATSPVGLSAVKVKAEPQCVGGDWETVMVSGRWTAGSTAGGGRNFPSHGQNPRVPLTVTYDPGGTNVEVTLRQHSSENDLQAIGFHIYKVTDSEAVSMVISGAVQPSVSCVPHAHSQEVSVRCRLPPAGYIILPSTYQPDCSAEYTLTIKHRIHRKALSSQECLGQTIQEISHVSVMSL